MDMMMVLKNDCVEMVEFLVTHGEDKEMKQVLVRQLVHHLIFQRRRTANASGPSPSTVSFSDLTNGEVDVLTVNEVDKLWQLQDPEIDAFVSKHRKLLLTGSLWNDASKCKNVHAIECLCLLLMKKNCVEMVDFLVHHTDDDHNGGDDDETMTKEMKQVLVRHLVRHFLALGRVPNANENESFTDWVTGDVSALTSDEVEKAARLQNPEIDLFVAKHRELLLCSSLWIDATECGNAIVIEYLCREASMPEWERFAMNIACANGDLPLVKLLFANGRRGLTSLTLEAMVVIPECGDLVDFLIEQKDEYIQGLIVDVVSRGLSRAATSKKTLVKRASLNTRLMDVVVPLVTKLLLMSPSLARRQELLEVAAHAGNVEMAQLLLSSLGTTTDSTVAIAMLPAMVKAARSGNKETILLLYANKGPEEVINVAQLRECFSSISDASAMAMLLSLLQEWDPSVRRQLEQERSAASSLFGFSSSTGAASSSSTSSNKRGNARAKRGGRRS